MAKPQFDTKIIHPRGSLPSSCPACGSGDKYPNLRYSTAVCLATLGREPVDIRKYGDLPNPHLQATCRNCGFVWLIETAMEIV